MATGISPYLSSQFDFDLSKFAFLVQCANSGAGKLLDLNPKFIQDGFEKPLQSFLDTEDTDEGTPCYDGGPVAWLFVPWESTKTYYCFGTKRKNDVVLPSQSRVSKGHFRTFINEEGAWQLRVQSQFGASVNGEELKQSLSISLNPWAPNEIVAGRFEFIIHIIPHTAGPTVSMSFDMSNIGCQPSYSNTLGSYSATLEAAESEANYSTTVGTSYSTTIGTTSSQESYPTTIGAYLIDSYYYCSEDANISALQASKVVVALHKRKGQFYLAKVYNKSQEIEARPRYLKLLDIKNWAHIVRYVDSHVSEDGFKIITDYLPRAEILTGLMASREAFVVYRQIAGALQSLEAAKIAHNDINANTILIEYKSGRITAYLTGFSESDDSEAGMSFRRDVSSLSQVVKSIIPRCDPALDLILSEAIHLTLYASDVCHKLEEIAPNYDGICPFKSMSVKKTMSLRRVVDENGVEAICLVDLLKIVLFHGAGPVSTDIMVRKVIRRDRLILLKAETSEEEIFCHYEDAGRLLHHVNSRLLDLCLDLSPPRHEFPRWYKTEYEIVFPITYHEPSGMVNITQILNLLGDEAQNCLDGISPRFQQVYGSVQWEGYYIDRESTIKILQRSSLELVGKVCEDPPQSDIFYNNDPDRYIIVASCDMLGLLFLHRDGTVVKLNGRQRSIIDTIAEYEKNGLLDVVRALQSDIPSKPDWKAYGSWISQTLRLLDEPNSPSEATAPNSLYDPEEPTIFRLGKRRDIDVPILPPPKRPQLGQISSDEKCKNWIEGPDIHPTAFIRKA